MIKKKRNIFIFFSIIFIGIMLFIKSTSFIIINIKNNTNKNISGLNILYIDKYKNIRKELKIAEIPNHSTYVLKKTMPDNFIEGNLVITYFNSQGIKKDEIIATFIDDGGARSNVNININSINNCGNLELESNNDFYQYYKK